MSLVDVGISKVYCRGLLYTVLITVFCYIIKSHSNYLVHKTNRIDAKMGTDTNITSKKDVDLKLRSPQLGSKCKNIRNTVKSVVEDEIFWSQELENMLPLGKFLFFIDD